MSRNVAWHVYFGYILLVPVCKNGFDMDKTEAKVMTFHQRGGGKRNRIRD